jgi:ribosomal protein S27AE
MSNEAFFSVDAASTMSYRNTCPDCGAAGFLRGRTWLCINCGRAWQ